MTTFVFVRGKQSSGTSQVFDVVFRKSFFRKFVVFTFEISFVVTTYRSILSTKTSPYVFDFIS